MSPEIRPDSPAPTGAAATSCTQDMSGQVASAICATNIACATVPPVCPHKEVELKPNTTPHTAWNTCKGPTQLLGCTTANTPPQPQQAQAIATWFQGCGIPPVTVTCPVQPTIQTWFHGCGIPPVTVTCPAPAPQAQTVHTWFHGCGIPPVTLTCPQGTGNVGQTGWYTCGQPSTNIPGCTTATTPPAPQGIHTWFHGCGIPPVTLTCPPHGTAATVCTQVQCHQPAAQAQVGQTGWYTCGQPSTNIPGCTTATTPPAPQQNADTLIGQTGWHTCGQQSTLATVCTQVQCHPATHLLGCTTATNAVACGTQPAAQQQNADTLIGQTGWYTCGQQSTAATVCTQVQCHPATHLLGCTTATNAVACGTQPAAQQQNADTLIGQTGWYTCGQQSTAATVCTQVQCTPPTHLLGCTTVTHNPTFGCQPATDIPGCTTATNAVACGTQPAAATIVGPTGWYTCHQQSTAATVCTQVQCHKPTQLLGCTTATNAVACGTQSPAAGTVVGPTGWYTCGHVPTCGNNTKIIATTYTQLNC